MCIRDRFQRFLQQSLNSAEPPPRLPFVSSNLLDTLGNQPFSQGQNSVRPTNESTESPFEIDRPLPAGWLQPRLWTSLSSYRKFLLIRPLFLSAFFILNITSAAHFKLSLSAGSERCTAMVVVAQSCVTLPKVIMF